MAHVSMLIHPIAWLPMLGCTFQSPIHLAMNYRFLSAHFLLIHIVFYRLQDLHETFVFYL